MMGKNHTVRVYRVEGRFPDDSQLVHSQETYGIVTVEVGGSDKILDLANDKFQQVYGKKPDRIKRIEQITGLELVLKKKSLLN